MRSSESETEDASDAPPPRWTRWFTAASAVFAVIAITITVVSVGPAQLLAELGSIGGWFAVIIGVEMIISCADAAALSGFLGEGGRRPGYGHVLRAQVSGRAINAVTPLGSLGEATKATILLQRTSSSRAIAAVVHYNLTSLGMILVAIAVGAPICAATLSLPAWMIPALWIGTAVAAGLLVVGALLVRRGMLVTAIDALARVRLVPRGKVAPWRAKLAAIDRHLRRHGTGIKHWTPAGWVVISRLLSWGLIWLVLAVVERAPSVGTMGALASVGSLISVVSAIVPMGLGVSEGGNAALFRALGEDPLLGVTLVVSRRVTSLAFAVVGLVLMVSSDTVERVRHKRGGPGSRSH